MLSKGSVAILDALGFKGIYNTIEPQKVLDAMVSCSNETYRLHEGFSDLSKKPDKIFGALGMPILHFGMYKLQIQFMSDTVIIACCYNDPVVEGATNLPDTPTVYRVVQDDEPLMLQTLQTVVQLTSYFLASAGRSEVPIAYRGCISFGELDIRFQSESNQLSSGFVIGPSVDAAANLHQAWDAGVVVLDERAEGIFWKIKTFVEQAPGYLTPALPLLLRHAVPVKHQGRLPEFDRLCVSPFGLLSEPGTRAQVLSNLLATFGRAKAQPDWDKVQVKKANTDVFLRQCLALHAGFQPGDLEPEKSAGG